jgi:hypothetical protein
MAITQATLGAGRVGLKALFAMEAAKVEMQYIDVVQRVDHTTQTAEVYKQYIGLGPSDATPEGNEVIFDDLAPLYVLAVKPILYSKGIKMSVQTSYTDQYKKFKNLTPELAKTFIQRRNLNVADLDNSGFTDTTKGMNSEPLYSASHNLGNNYMYNRPIAVGTTAGASPTTVDLAFSPLMLEWAWKDIRRQVSARNLPMMLTGKLDIKVPPELFMQASRALKSIQLAGTNANDTNKEIQDRFNAPKVIDYYTSATAWFLKSSNVDEHGLFFLEQMPYDVEMLPRDRFLQDQWVAYESWAFGWFKPYGVWGTAGQ